MDELQKKKRIIILNKFGEKKYDYKTFLKLKRVWICNNTGLKNDEFLNAARDFDEMYTIYLSRLGAFESYWSSLSKKIYDSKSKARILSLIVFLLSITFLVLLKDINDSSIILSLIEPQSAKIFLTFIILFSIITFLLFESMASIIKLFKILLTLVSINLDKSRSKSPEVVRIFIKDLLILHRLTPMKYNKTTN